MTLVNVVNRMSGKMYLHRHALKSCALLNSLDIIDSKTDLNNA